MSAARACCCATCSRSCVPGTEPLAPESPLILATGPFAGTVAATCSRLAVGCKSPATGLLLDSYVGGSFAPELKFAGYDLVIVTGRAAEPVLVTIEDDQVEFLPARGRYWGLDAGALEARVRDELGPRHKVLSTGPAGETSCGTPAFLQTSTIRPAAGVRGR